MHHEVDCRNKLLAIERLRQWNFEAHFEHARPRSARRAVAEVDSTVTPLISAILSMMSAAAFGCGSPRWMVRVALGRGPVARLMVLVALGAATMATGRSGYPARVPRTKSG